MECRDKIVSEDYVSLILDFRLKEVDFAQEEDFPEEGEQFCYREVEDPIGVLYVHRQALPLFSLSRVMYRYIPQLYGLGGIRSGGGDFDPGPLEEAGILAQQQPPLELTGRGVILAVIDTGISYEDPVFRYSDGSSRILAIWDQTDQTGKPPEGFSYGTEYRQEQINEALQRQDPHTLVPQRDEIGHGTALASAAAGSRIQGGAGFVGAAPDALLVVVKVRQAKGYLRDYYMVAEDVPAYSTDDLMFAVRYAQEFAYPFLRPVVLCLGMGTSLGSHDSGSVFSQYLQSVTEKVSRALVIGGGNQGNAAGHFRAQLTEESRRVEIRVGENTAGFLAELWGASPSSFRIGIRSPGGEMIPEVDFRIGREVEHTFVYEKTRVTLNYIRNERNTGDDLVVLRFERPSPGVWSLYVAGARTAPGAVFDLWLSCGQLTGDGVYFLTPSPEITLTMPAYVMDAVTVTAYDSRNNSFFYRSGQGFSRTGGIKPDLAAPGVSVGTAEGPYSGGAVAAALTAGAAAQLMQWCVVENNAPFVSGREIRGYLSRGAAEETADEYPSPRWGYGRLDMRKTFDEIAGRNS